MRFALLRRALLYQFDAVAEWVVNMGAAHAGNVVGLVNPNTSRLQFRDSGSIVRTAQCGMSFFRRAKIRLYSQMDLHAAALKPASATLGQLGRLCDLRHSEHTGIKSPRAVLFARRHGELNVIYHAKRTR